MLAGKTKDRATGCEHRQPCRRSQQLGEPRRSLDDLLEVVEHEQQPLSPNPLEEIGLVLCLQHACDLRQHEIGLTNRGQLDQVNAVAKVVYEPRGRFEG